jgi:hypothetical protein
MARTVRVSAKLSEKLPVLVGQVTAEKLAKQTYSDAIKYLLDRHVVFPPELISRVEELISNRQLGYSSKEEFLLDAARRMLKSYDGNIECISVPKDLYEKTKAAIQDLNLPFMGVDDFAEEQLKKLLEQHAQWKEQMEETEEAEE